MENKAITRKDFFLLTFTLIGSTAVAGSACDDDDNTTGAGGAGGSGTGTAGSTGRGGTTGSAGTTGNAGSGGTTGSAGSGGVSSCPSSQLPDNTGHVHTVSVSPSTLSSTTTQSFNTSIADGHMHMVALAPAQLSMLASGGSLTVTSNIVNNHQHMYMVTCQ